MMWTVQGTEISEFTFPISFKNGGTLRVNNAFKFKENSPNQYRFMQFPIRFLFETEDGVEISARSFINHYPYFSNREIKEIVQKVGEQDE